MSHRFRVESSALDGDRAIIRGSAHRKLCRVLRLGPGDAIELYDGDGRARAGTVESVGPTSSQITIAGRDLPGRESPLAATLAVAWSKGAKLDWVIEKATELGVKAIVPFLSARTVPDPERPERRLERWRRLAEAATEQCGRTTTPRLASIATFEDVVALGAQQDRRVLFWELAPVASTTEENPTTPRSVLLVTGPEGGFTAAEVEHAGRAGFEIASLGPRILRAETAAVVALAGAQTRWGDLP